MKKMGTRIANHQQVKPYPFFTAAAIVVALALFDTVGCVVLLIGAYIFMKKGHTGLAVALSVVNIISPDAIPLVDECFQVIVVLLPIYKSYQESQNALTAIQDGVSSYAEYENRKQENPNIVNQYSTENAVWEENDADFE